MLWNWAQSLIYGLIAGASEFLPVSAEGHHAIFQTLTGAGNEANSYRLFCHAAILIALVLSCRPQLDRLRRERKLASTPRSRRHRQPDISALLDIRVVRTATAAMLVSMAACYLLSRSKGPLWLVSLYFAANGGILYLCIRRPYGNKDARSVSALDAVLMGLGAGAAMLPGISRIGVSASVCQLRGGDRQYALNTTLLLSIPAVMVSICLDIYLVLAFGMPFSFMWLLHYLLSAFAAFLGAYFSIILMRFLAVKVGFSGFAFYCWGAALFSVILYLMI